MVIELCCLFKMHTLSVHENACKAQENKRCSEQQSTSHKVTGYLHILGSDRMTGSTSEAPGALRLARAVGLSHVLWTARKAGSPAVGTTASQDEDAIQCKLTRTFKEDGLGFIFKIVYL